MAWRTVWKAQRGGERPCDATVAFGFGAVTYARCSDGRGKPARLRRHAFVGKRVAAGMAQHVGRLRLLLALHWGVPHDLFNACLIHGEL